MLLGSSDPGTSYDGVVIGAGPAGLSLALEYAAGARRVLVLESGDEGAPRSELANAIGYGHFSDHYWNRHSIRELGGTSKVWSGWVTTPREIDFDNPATGWTWPIRRTDLLPYYERATRVLDRDRSIVLHETPVWPGFVYRPYSRQPPIRFAEKYLDTLKASTTVDVAAGCTALGLDANGARSAVTALRYWHHASGTIKTLSIAPTQFVVLAMGGVGTPQFLLQPRADGAAPVGTESGHVGACIMEHPHFYGAGAAVVDTDLDAMTPPSSFGPSLHAVVADATLSRAHRLLACNMVFRKADDSDLSRHLASSSGRAFFHYEIDVRAEMRPSASNRVFLGAERNALGLHRAGVRCIIGAGDFESAETTLRLLGEALVATGQGRVRVNNDRIYQRPNGGGHILGTTRMGESRATSVVDADCRVHGYDNLFVAGSSVFTTGGFANPTFTIVALALRLADTLTTRFTRSA